MTIVFSAFLKLLGFSRNADFVCYLCINLICMPALNGIILGCFGDWTSSLENNRSPLSPALDPLCPFLRLSLPQPPGHHTLPSEGRGYLSWSTSPQKCALRTSCPLQESGETGSDLELIWQDTLGSNWYSDTLSCLKTWALLVFSLNVALLWVSVSCPDPGLPESCRCVFLWFSFFFLCDKVHTTWNLLS